MPTLPTSFIPDTSTPSMGALSPQGGIPSSFIADTQPLTNPSPQDTGSTDLLSNTGDALVAGGTQIATGFQQTQEAAGKGDLGLMGRGILNEAAGVINTASAPITAIVKSIGNIPIPFSDGETVGSRIQKNGIQPIADQISNMPALQSFMKTYPNADEVIGNAMTIGMTLLGLREAPNLEGAPEVPPTEGGTPPIEGEPPPVNPETTPPENPTITLRKETYQNLADKYTSVGNAVDTAVSKGFDPISDLASDDRFTPEVNDGKIDSSSAIKNLNTYIKPLAQAERASIEAEGVSVNFDEFAKNVKDEIDNSGLVERGSSYKTIQSKVASDLEVYKENFVNDKGTIDLTKLDDIKNTKYSIANWNNEDAQIADKAVARAARETIVDNSTADIQAMNDKMSQYYSARDVLDAIDGKTVKGGRLGKYFARTIGGIAGSHFGPVGAIGGAILGDKIEGAILNSKFNPMFGNNAPLITPPPEELTTAQSTLSKAQIQLPPKK